MQSTKLRVTVSCPQLINPAIIRNISIEAGLSSDSNTMLYKNSARYKLPEDQHLSAGNSPAFFTAETNTRTYEFLFARMASSTNKLILRKTIFPANERKSIQKEIEIDTNYDNTSDFPGHENKIIDDLDIPLQVCLSISQIGLPGSLIGPILTFTI